MGNISRRDFLKICGLTVASSVLGTSLYGCSDENNEQNEEIEQKETTEDGVWTKTGNKETRRAYEHMVYEIIPFKDDIYDIDVRYSYNNDEIVIPAGYAYVSSEAMITKNGSGSSTYATKYNYVNTVDVEVEEYVNEKTGEVGFPFAGTPIDLEKTESMPKVLVR